MLWVGVSSCRFDQASVGDASIYDAPDWYDNPPRVSESDAWTIVVLPDTQDYTESYPEILAHQVDWILAQREVLDIRFVAHLGDIVQRDTPVQWEVAQAQLGRLSGHVPFCLPPGNHDLYGGGERRSSLIDEYFTWSALGESHERGGQFDPASIWNTYHVIDGNGGPWLMLGLEFGPRRAVLEWANDVVAAHPDHAVMMVTHAYLYVDDRRYDWSRFGRVQAGNPHAYALDDVTDGEQMWQGFVSRHRNTRLVVSGHARKQGVGRRTSSAIYGDRVHELLSNYQRGVVHRNQRRGRSGYLRVLHVELDDRRIDVATYSPWRGTWLNDEDNRFVLELDPVDGVTPIPGGR